MSDETMQVISDARRDWVADHRHSYLSSGGAEGHIMDISVVGGRKLATHCLIKYVGRKSGKIFITPLCYADIGGEIVICASKGGADHHPAWYLNLRDMETVDIQIATQAFTATWREPEGDERAKVWDFFVDCHPFYQTYQDSTRRVLPLVMFSIGESIPVFKAGDATGMRPA